MMPEVKANDLSWINDSARCVDPGVDPDWFFIEEHDHQLAVTQVCHGCPLLLKCREYALHNRVDGVWGGYTERKIIAERKRLGITPHNVSGDTYLYTLGLQNVQRNYSKQ